MLLQCVENKGVRCVLLPEGQHSGGGTESLRLSESTSLRLFPQDPRVPLEGMTSVRYVKSLKDGETGSKTDHPGCASEARQCLHPELSENL